MKINKLDRSPRHRGRKWGILRKNIFSSNPFCAICKTQFAEELDHIIPLFKGGTNDEDNLQGLCKKCHAEKTKRDLNLKTGVGLDGWPIET